MINFQKNRRLFEFSTLQIGGPIDYFAEIRNEDEMKEAFSFVRKENLPFLILGKGSNCLFSDQRFCGVVLLNKIDPCLWSEKRVQVGAGFSFPLLSVQSTKRHFSGLEFATGIPGTVGGAIFMNAGANSQETKDALRSVRYLHLDGQIEEFQRENLTFSYRKSPFQTMKGAILSAVFQFKENVLARKEQLKIITKRMETQPLKSKSAGCIFKNPEDGPSAGALIDQLGLKGVQIGGAKISEVHANFIVNQANATAEDVKRLIALIQEEAFNKKKIRLKTEIQIFDERI